MKISNTRRRHRRPLSREITPFKKDNQSEQQFFGETMHEPFFKPALTGVQADTVHCKEEKKEEQKMQRSADKKEEEKIQKKEDKKEEDKVQKKEATAATNSTSAVASNYISSINGKGQSMDAKAKSFYENRMGADFSQVKIHTGKEAADSAKDVNAKAYTVGNDIVFNEGQYNTNSDEGKKLMAHELTHVMQNNTNQTGDIKRQTSTPVPATAVVDPATQIATFSINSVNVVVEPDQTLARGTSVSFHGSQYTVNSSGALTVSYLRPRVVPTYTGTGRNRKVSSITLTFTLYIKTFFGRSAAASDRSAYGRGTTADDIAAGNTSLGFHEGNHGQDYQHYISQNPLPQITLAVPASMRDYNAAIRLFNREMQTYSTAMSDHSHTNTDMVGTPEP
jgi:hypothetical protein